MHRLVRERTLQELSKLEVCAVPADSVVGDDCETTNGSKACPTTAIMEALLSGNLGEGTP